MLLHEVIWFETRKGCFPGGKSRPKSLYRGIKLHDKQDECPICSKKLLLNNFKYHLQHVHQLSQSDAIEIIEKEKIRKKKAKLEQKGRLVYF